MANIPGFPGYAGWGDAEAQADFRATGGAGKGGAPAQSSVAPPPPPPAPVLDPIAEAQKIRQFNIESNQPYAASLQASIPEVTQRFAQTNQQLTGQLTPLRERYQTLLDGLTNTKNQQVQTAQTAASQEFGRRGIPASSTAYSDYLGKQVNPIEQNWGNQITQANQGQTQAVMDLQNLIANLAPQEVDAKRKIQDILGQIQSGDPSSAIQAALSSLNQQEQQRQYGQTFSENQRQFGVNTNLSQAQQALDQSRFDFEKTQTKASDPYAQFMKVGEGESIYDLAGLQSIFNKGKTYKAGGDGEDSY